MINCLSPSVCYRCGNIVSKDGVKSQRLVWSYSEALNFYHGDIFAVRDSECSLPCGHCEACRIRQRKEMSTRLAHEASMHEQSVFITLTYDDAHLPIGLDGNPTLCIADVQKFIKRLRRHLEYVPKKYDGRDHVSKPIRYFCVGEYGHKTHRPHYHLLIFGWSPSDSKFHRQSKNIVSFRSAQIEKLWKCGFSEFSGVSPHVARYCARYVTKKITSDYDLHDDQLPEFTLSSKRNGGIGSSWCDLYGVDALRKRFCTYRMNDKIIKASVPKYYYNRIRKTKLKLWLDIRDDRIEFLRRHKHDVDSSDVSFGNLVRSCEVYRYNESQRKENEIL